MKATIYFMLFISVILIALIIVYAVREYIQYKPQFDTQFTSTESQLNKEVSDRLNTVQDIVGQINTVNDSIYTTLQEDTAQQNQFITAMDNQQGGFVNALNTAFPFVDSKGKPISITNLPGSAQPNMILMNNVTATMDLTASDLNTTGNVNMCSATGGRCIQFPDKNGNLYVTDIGTTPGQVILDGQNGTQINNSLNVNGPINLNTAKGSQTGIIQSGPNPNELIVDSQMTGMGNFTSTVPNATLHVNGNAKSSSPSSDSSLLLRLSKNVNTNVGSTAIDKVFEVTQTAQMRFYKYGHLKGGIHPINQTNGGPGLKIETKNLNIPGNLTVKGLITGNVVGSTPSSGPSPAPSYYS
jgi:hypothetical protein